MIGKNLIAHAPLAFAISALLLPGIGSAQGLGDRGERIVAEAFEPNTLDADNLASPAVSLHGAEFAYRGFTGAALRLSNGKSATIDAGDVITTRAGTISFWVKPNSNSVGTQTYIALKWADQPAGYLAISQGWWEPIGQDRLYFILSNTRFIHCSVKYTLPRGKWSQVVATWASGETGYCALYVNGEPMARHQASFAGNQSSAGPIYLGSDTPTTVARGRSAHALIDDLVILHRAVSAAEAAQAYASARREHTSPENIAGPWVEEALSRDVRQAASDPTSPAAETRAIFHEDIEWALSREETDRIISRISAAGLNIYMPCVWYGPGARFPSETVPVDPRLLPHMSQEDPLAYLIDKAHSAGIEVHACVTVARRGSALFPEFAGDGTPSGAYDLHNPAFRKTIVALVAELVRRYPVDGVNLDYIRTMGICTSASCAADYRQRLGRFLRDDIADAQADAVAAKSIADWNFAAVTAIVRDVAAAVRAIRPDVVISVDAHPNNPELLRQGQNSVRWANDGLVDVVFDMEYGRIVDVENIETVRSMLDEPSRLAIMLTKYDRDGATSTDRPAELLEKYIQLVRRRWPDMGIGIYNYPLSDEQTKALSTGVFAPRVPPNCPRNWGQLCLSKGVAEPRGKVAPQ